MKLFKKPFRTFVGILALPIWALSLLIALWAASIAFVVHFARMVLNKRVGNNVKALEIRGELYGVCQFLYNAVANGYSNTSKDK